MARDLQGILRDHGFKIACSNRRTRYGGVALTGVGSKETLWLKDACGHGTRGVGGRAGIVLDQRPVWELAGLCG